MSKPLYAVEFPRIPFLVLTASFVVAGCAGIGLAFDGSYLWFQVVETGYPFIVHNRVINLVFQAIPLLVSRYLHDPLIISALFSFAYLLPPLVGLLLSWLVVRHRAPGLMIWTVGWVLLAPLPGQMDIVAEANIALQLVWPLFLMILLGVRATDFPLIGMLVILVISTHPISIVLLGLAAIVSTIIALLNRTHFSMNLITAVFLLTAAIINLLRLTYSLSVYESAILSPSLLRDHYSAGLAGEPLIFILLVWGAFSMFLLSRTHKTLFGSLQTKYISVLLLVLGGLCLCFRAVLPTHWAGIVSYHFYSLFAALPFALMAVIDVYLWQHRPTHNFIFRDDRRLMTQAALLITAGIMLVHALSWSLFVSEVRQSIATASDNCLSTQETPELAWGKQTILDHWSVSSFSLWIQGIKPTKVIVFEHPCEAHPFVGSFQLVPWLRYDWGHRWFDLRILETQLQSD